MSTIRKRKGKWFVEIRKKYFKPIRKTFEYKLDAEKYAREKQAEIDKGFLVSYEQAQSTKLGELLERYRLEITSKKKSNDIKEVIGSDVKIIHTKSDDNRSYHVSSEKIGDVLNLIQHLLQYILY